MDSQADPDLVERPSLSPETTGDEPSRNPTTSRGAWSWALLAVVAVAALFAPYLAPYLTSGGQEPRVELPILREVPPFELRSEDGEIFSSASLAGQVWVADFFFTRCSQACPLMTSRMREVQEAIVSDASLLAGARIISFSLDAAHDTPEVLTAYARHNGADLRCWRFLTGAPEAIRELCESGFGLSAGGGSGEGEARVVHSDRFGLVDAQGRIRGMYRPTAEPEDLERLLRDLRALVRAD